MLTFKDVPSGASKTESALQVFKRTIKNIAEPRLMSWLLIMSGFWFMFMQLWDLLPNFIAEWVDTRDVGAFLEFSTAEGDIVQLRTAISLVSRDQARLNLRTEMEPFGWDFLGRHGML